MNSSHPFDALTPDAVIQAIEAEGFFCDGRIYPLNSYENRVYQVGIEEADPVIAKFYRPQRWSREQIQEEHDFCLELADAEFPVVAPLLDHQGHSLRQQQGFFLAIYPRRGGQAPELDYADNLEVMGRSLGQLHNIGYNRLFEHRPTFDIDSFVRQSSQFLLENQFIPGELQPAYTSLIENILPRLEEAFANTRFESLRLHGDCHPGNILWRDDAPHYVDFDDARNGPAVQDIWMLLSGDKPQQQRQLQQVLTGYRQFCPFNAAELTLVEPLRTMRLINYSAWLARRWDDPAFPHNFTWFNTVRYWSDHILTLREQQAALQEQPLKLPEFF
ncbi:serine/threonine protein kinase [Candidatus Pelagadaptatus aseana]|uniref:serine/threonine protein kinase n=1 Tax=Candidatus Pelagadaptatus aseana TaxID=3120508 RepID=UPI003C6EC829